jgi:hypothetical protein
MGAFYSNTIARFINDDDKHIIGALATQSGLSGFYQLLHTQTLSWGEEIKILKSALIDVNHKYPKIADFGILLEYPIARREKRIDVVIIANDLIIIIEFKVGKSDYSNSDKEQLLDYCLDIRDFHFESRNKIIIPLLVATSGKYVDTVHTANKENVKEIITTNALSLADTLIDILENYNSDFNNLNFIKWNESDYSPTPTIIEAAQTLYSGKSVIEISRSHAGTKNLTKTSDAVVNAIKIAKANNQKIICFITGVPGAGKTLAGLNIAHDKEFQGNEKSLATFLSGNVPLIKVLKEALVRDAFKKIKRGEKLARKKETDRIIAFIENVHRFLDHYFFDKERIPNNKIVIFDEAQRAWNAEQSMKKFQRPFSEAEMMFEIMNRQPDWAVIVALVGGGQEINTGEAGLPEWGVIIREKYPHWITYISPQLKTGNHSTGNLSLFDKVPENISIVENNDLHLDVSIRSYKAEELSNWVNLILINQPVDAIRIFNDQLSNYKIVLTRDLDKAKQWLRINCKGSRRMGIVASSGGRRLRPHGIEVKTELEEAQWFLNPRDDIRSSYYLELPATEFRIQGLELDWVGVCWDLDLKRGSNNWDYNAFKGTKWSKVKNSEMKKFIINKYRVLLTRAREGMIIFVPPGSIEDPTRNPEYYNEIVDYLISCGVVEL